MHRRSPFPSELLIANDNTMKVHALRPPRPAPPGWTPDALFEDLRLSDVHSTACGWRFAGLPIASLVEWSETVEAFTEVCRTCFGKGRDHGNEGSSSESSSASSASLP